MEKQRERLVHLKAQVLEATQLPVREGCGSRAPVLREPVHLVHFFFFTWYTLSLPEAVCEPLGTEQEPPDHEPLSTQVSIHTHYGRSGAPEERFALQGDNMASQSQPKRHLGWASTPALNSPVALQEGIIYPEPLFLFLRNQHCFTFIPKIQTCQKWIQKWRLDGTRMCKELVVFSKGGCQLVSSPPLLSMGTVHLSHPTAPPHPWPWEVSRALTQGLP